MHTIPVIGWMLRRASGTPMGVLWVGLCLVSGPILGFFSPPELLQHGNRPAEQVLQLSYLAALLGAMLAMDSLEQARWMLDRCGPWRRVSVGWIALSTNTLLGPLLVLTGSELGGWVTDWPQTIGPLILVSSHLALLSGWLLETPGTPRGRIWLLPFLSWLLPGLVQSSPAPVSWLLALVQTTPGILLGQETSPIELLSQTGPIMVLAAAHGLLIVSRQSHEVRHPR